MTDQIRISDTGELETVPTTWDGEPMYSPASISEARLFNPEAFEQIKGQTAMKITDSCEEQCSCGAPATWTHPRTGTGNCGHPACVIYWTLRDEAAAQKIRARARRILETVDSEDDES